MAAVFVALPSDEAGTAQELHDRLSVLPISDAAYDLGDGEVVVVGVGDLRTRVLDVLAPVAGAGLVLGAASAPVDTVDPAALVDLALVLLALTVGVAVAAPSGGGPRLDDVSQPGEPLVDAGDDGIEAMVYELSPLTIDPVTGEPDVTVEETPAGGASPAPVVRRLVPREARASTIFGGTTFGRAATGGDTTAAAPSAAADRETTSDGEPRPTSTSTSTTTRDRDAVRDEDDGADEDDEDDGTGADGVMADVDDDRETDSSGEPRREERRERDADEAEPRTTTAPPEPTTTTTSPPPETTTTTTTTAPPETTTSTTTTTAPDDDRADDDKPDDD